MAVVDAGLSIVPTHGLNTASSPRDIGLPQYHRYGKSCRTVAWAAFFLVGLSQASRSLRRRRPVWMHETSPRQAAPASTSRRVVQSCHAAHVGGADRWIFRSQGLNTANVGSSRNASLHSATGMSMLDTGVAEHFSVDLSQTSSPFRRRVQCGFTKLSFDTVLQHPRADE